MSRIKIPKTLHDIFGEEQSPAALTVVIAGGISLGAAILFGFLPEFRTNLGGHGNIGLPRFALAMLLALDIAAGCIANFTEGTSNFYAKRPVNRLIFIAIHVHLPVFALLLGLPILPFLALWAYTAGGAFVVNGFAGRPSQNLVGGSLLAFGIALVMLLPGLSAASRLVSALFLIKVLYAFAVDHYKAAPARQGSR